MVRGQEEPPPPPPRERGPGEGPAAEAPPTESAEKATYSNDWSGAGRFSDEEPLPLSFWLLGPRPRRGILTSLLIWGGIAPVTNLWGSGSFLLSLAPEAARDAKLDTFYPVSSRPRYPYDKGSLDYSGGFKRYVDEANRFEFRFPAEYVQDQAVFMRNADAAFERRTDPLAAMPSKTAAPRRQGVAVAVGPPGETKEENLSVVVGRVEPGFALRSLGAPEDAARRLLNTTINRQAVVADTTLLGAKERPSAKSNLPLYQFEYRVDYTDAQQPPSYTVCVVGASRDTLYTFASRVPERVWKENAAQLREAASSFVLY